MGDYRYIYDERTGIMHRILGVVDDTLAEEGIAADAKATRDALALKANKSEPIDTATAVIGNTGTEDKVPYSFRATGIKSARVREKIVGATVAWNQLCVSAEGPSQTTAYYGLFVNQDVTFVQGHKYIISFVQPSGCKLYIQNRTYISTGGSSIYFDAPSSATLIQRMLIASGSGTENVINLVAKTEQTTTAYQLTKCMLIDLTQMFGSTIADYIYSLETNNAGDGVNFFRSLFQKDYYAYDAGSLQSAKTSMKRSVGFNLWDEVWELGAYDPNTGAKIDNNAAFRSKNYIPVSPNTDYYIYTNKSYPSNVDARVFWYDKSKNYISFANGFNSKKTSPANAYYCTFRMQITHSDDTEICFNISGTRNGQYEPYSLHEYPLDSDLELRGIPKLDANNKLYSDGDVYENDGTVTRRYGIKNLGDITWTKNSDGRFDAYLSGFKNSTNPGIAPNIICAKYRTDIPSNVYSKVNDKTISCGLQNPTLWVYDSAYTDAAVFSQTMNGVYLVYELATPVTESADPYQEIQIIDEYGTEEFVDAGVSAGTRDVSVPVGHDSFYYTDIVGRVERLPDDFSTLIAPTEVAFKATRAYTAKQFLIINNQLYKVTASIANGATITPGTNVTATTIGEVLTSLLS